MLCYSLWIYHWLGILRACKIKRTINRGKRETTFSKKVKTWIGISCNCLFWLLCNHKDNWKRPLIGFTCLNKFWAVWISVRTSKLSLSRASHNYSWTCYNSNKGLQPIRSHGHEVFFFFFLTYLLLALM